MRGNPPALRFSPFDSALLVASSFRRGANVNLDGPCSGPRPGCDGELAKAGSLEGVTTSNGIPDLYPGGLLFVPLIPLVHDGVCFLCAESWLPLPCLARLDSVADVPRPRLISRPARNGAISRLTIGSRLSPVVRPRRRWSLGTFSGHFATRILEGCGLFGPSI